MKAEEAWGGWRSRDARVNRLSLARMFLFGARDVWFVVGIPVYFQAVLSDGTPEGRREAFFLIGGFLALWIIAYGAVQALAPASGGKAPARGRDDRKAIRWAGLLVPIPFLLAGAAWAGRRAAPWLTATLIAGLLLFGFVFAVNSSVHSYLILAFGSAERITRDVGFYYMANAAGRLIGTLLSGLSYQIGRAAAVPCHRRGHGNGRSGVVSFWYATGDLIVSFVKSLLSAFGQMIAQMISGAVVVGIGGAAVSLYLGFGLLPGLLAGAVVGLVVVIIVQVMVSTGGNL
jgi:hypothetical protein